MSRRRQYLVNTQFQFKILIRILLIIGIVAVVTALNITVAAMYTISRTYSPEYAKDTLFNTVGYIWSNYRAHLAAILAVDLVVAIALSLFLSHRLAGPILRLRDGLHRLADGDLTARFLVRKGDILADFPQDLEVAVTALRNRCAVLKDLFARLTQHQQIPEQLIKTIQEIEQKLSEIKTDLPPEKPKGE